MIPGAVQITTSKLKFFYKTPKGGKTLNITGDFFIFSEL